MTKTKERKKPVVGQMVYVVFGGRRGDPGFYKVMSVGRKYATVDVPGYDRRPAECRFSVEDWKSLDGDHNPRVNGYGFDVYESKEEYERERLYFRERSRLSERIGSDLYYSSGLLNRLPHEAVMKIHAILDEVEAGKVEDGE